MEKFILKSKLLTFDDSNMKVRLFPDHYYLFDKIEISSYINSNQDVNLQITDLINFYTVILFEKIQEMGNIPQEIKNNIEL